MRGRARERGFTLIEVMVVIALLAIIAAITIPNLRDSRKNANESAAVAALRAIHAAENMVYTRDVDGDGRGNYVDLPTLVDTVLLDPRFTSVRSGYVFEILRADVGGFFAWCKPAERGITGDRYFGIDESGTLFEFRTESDAQTEQNGRVYGQEAGG